MRGLVTVKKNGKHRRNAEEVYARNRDCNPNRPVHFLPEVTCVRATESAYTRTSRSRRFTLASSTAFDPQGNSLADLSARIGEIEWYHSLSLSSGVRTPGVFDHNAVLAKYPLPDRLDGLRVLDVATFDGYWAFEMERRGAKEVVALDVSCARELDLPRWRRQNMSDSELDAPFGTGFRLAHKALNSRVQRVEMNVYNMTPERIGTFDLVHLGSLLLHLKNPLKALENLRDVCSTTAIISDCYSPKLPLKLLRYLGGHDNCAWWSLSLGSLKQMIIDAGFSNVQLRVKYSLKHGKTGKSVRHAAFSAQV
jgi:tRNA (mo5U34)-methyltransferase